MSKAKKHKYVSRAGDKLEFALEAFQTDVKGLVCADFGCSTGGFTDCMLKQGAAKFTALTPVMASLTGNCEMTQSCRDGKNKCNACCFA